MSSNEKKEKGVVPGGRQSKVVFERASQKVILPTGREVVVLEMTAKEEATLRQVEKVRGGYGVEEVLSSCVEGLKSQDELLSWQRGDRFALMVYIRILSYGEEYKFRTQCPVCRGSQESVINLDELPVRKPDLDAPRKIKLQRSGWEVEFHPLVGRDEFKLINATRDDPNSIVAYELYLATDKLNGESNKEKFGGLEGFIALPAKDCRQFKKALTAIECGLETSVSVVCRMCRHEYTVGMPFGTDFFLPGE